MLRRLASAGAIAVALCTAIAFPALAELAQSIERDGVSGNLRPALVSVRDVAGDQGGRVRLSWNASDTEALPQPVVGEYWIWRAVPAHVVRLAIAEGARIISAHGYRDAASLPRGRRLFELAVDSVATTYWEYVGSAPAAGRDSYSYIATTTTDSTETENALTWFRVQARAYPASWDSNVDSGYSVDNLGPAIPRGLAATFGGPTTTLAWNANSESDLAGYRLYRGTTAGFVPGPGNRVASPTQASFLDAAGGPFVYKLSAVDTHGNESGFAIVIPTIVGVHAANAAGELALAPPSPNPASRGCSFRFSMPREAHVTLDLVNVAGRRVRTILDETRPAGEQAVAWNGLDETGRALANGMYVIVLRCEGATITERLLVLR